MKGMMMTTWQPIETAPKDGIILGLIGDSIPDLPFVAVLQWWDAATWYELGWADDELAEPGNGAWAAWSRDGDDWSMHAPTHWMPLPPPPATTTKGLTSE